MNPPVLYSFRRCPYAIRARIALRYSQMAVEIREVSLKNKPNHLLQISPKGTVPVLFFSDGHVIDQSLSIMQWALHQQDPDDWLLMALPNEMRKQADGLIKENDFHFKPTLDRYKYANRFPEHPQEVYRNQGECFLQSLEDQLQSHSYLYQNHCSLADIAIFPFVRQFAQVDEDWFARSPYPALRHWLNALSNSTLFLDVMRKQTPWLETET